MFEQCQKQKIIQYNHGGDRSGHIPSLLIHLLSTLQQPQSCSILLSQKHWLTNLLCFVWIEENDKKKKDIVTSFPIANEEEREIETREL